MPTDLYAEYFFTDSEKNEILFAFFCRDCSVELMWEVSGKKISSI